jgi:hypothetical protein
MAIVGSHKERFLFTVVFRSRPNARRYALSGVLLGQRLANLERARRACGDGAKLYIEALQSLRHDNARAPNDC